MQTVKFKFAIAQKVTTRFQMGQPDYWPNVGRILCQIHGEGNYYLVRSYDGKKHHLAESELEAAQ